MAKDYAQALHEFWSGFGWSAYDATTVPSKSFTPQMPRITYEVAYDEFETDVYLSVSLWDYGYSWENISKKADEIYSYVGLGGRIIQYDDGYIWIRRGHPFAQRMADEDDAVRRIVINVTVEYFTGK